MPLITGSFFKESFIIVIELPQAWFKRSFQQIIKPFINYCSAKFIIKKSPANFEAGL